MNNCLNYENVEKIGRPIINDIIDAHTNGNFDQFMKYGSGNLENKSLQERFNHIVNEKFKPLGQVSSIKYLGYLKKNEIGPTKKAGFILLWKAQYEKATEEILWQLFLSEIDGEVKVGGVMFV